MSISASPCRRTWATWNLPTRSCPRRLRAPAFRGGDGNAQGLPRQARRLPPTTRPIPRGSTPIPRACFYGGFGPDLGRGRRPRRSAPGIWPSGARLRAWISTPAWAPTAMASRILSHQHGNPGAGPRSRLVRRTAWTEPKRGTCDPATRATGSAASAMSATLPGVEVNFVTLEYGTYPRELGSQGVPRGSLAAPHGPGGLGLRHREGPRDQSGAAASSSFPTNDPWKEMVLWRAFPGCAPKRSTASEKAEVRPAKFACSTSR